MRSVGHTGRSPVSSIDSSSFSVASSTEDMLDNPEEYLCRGISRHDSSFSNYDNMDDDEGMTTPVQSADQADNYGDDEFSPPLPEKKSAAVADVVDGDSNCRLYDNYVSTSEPLSTLMQQSVVLRDDRHQQMNLNSRLPPIIIAEQSVNHSVSQQAMYNHLTTQTNMPFEPQSSAFTSSSMLSHSSKSVAVRSIDSGYLSSASQQHFSLHNESSAICQLAGLPPLPPKFSRS